MDCTVIIPAYRPPDSLLTFLGDLKKAGFREILLVDDGSGEAWRPLFEEAVLAGASLLSHGENRGKGEALKTAFRFCIERESLPAAVITADCDGQHQIDDISKLFYTIRTAPQTIFLGVRGFEGRIPLRSRLGNSTASLLMKTLYRFPFGDTQTGLRAFPGSLLNWLTEIPGKRYEYETNVLIAAAREHIPVEAVTVKTIYGLSGGISHYRPLRDSLRVTAAMVLPFRRKE
ncbi:MAG: glycosyltransferase family 2 protein [Clostridia bacterium]